jgi:hypothetical protein
MKDLVLSELYVSQLFMRTFTGDDNNLVLSILYQFDKPWEISALSANL